MHIVAMASEKGGVGKTACCVNLACQATAAGEYAVIVDLDPQQSSLKWGQRRDGSRPETYTAQTATLESTIKKLRRSGVTWCFLDLPGRTGSATASGIKLSNLVLIPSRPHAIDLEGTHDVVRMCLQLKRRYAFLMNIAPLPASSARTKQVMEALRSANHKVCDVVIHQRLAVPDALSAGKGISEYAAKDPAGAEYAQLFEWISNEV